MLNMAGTAGIPLPSLNLEGPRYSMDILEFAWGRRTSKSHTMILKNGALYGGNIELLIVCRTLLISRGIYLLT